MCMQLKYHILLFKISIQCAQNQFSRNILMCKLLDEIIPWNYFKQVDSLDSSLSVRNWCVISLNMSMFMSAVTNIWAVKMCDCLRFRLLRQFLPNYPIIQNNGQANSIRTTDLSPVAQCQRAAWAQKKIAKHTENMLTRIMLPAEPKHHVTSCDWDPAHFCWTENC